MVSCQGLVIQVFKLSRVQWCRRLLCAIYSCLCGFMSRVVFLGFQAFQSSVVQEIVVHNLQFFVWFHVGGLCFKGFKLSRVQWCRRLLCTIFSSFVWFHVGGLCFKGFKLSRVQQCRRLLCTIYSFLCGFMLGLVFLGFQAF
jgi:hypothetical protein